MGTLASQFAGLDIRENCFLGKDFIVEVEKKLKELNIEKINLVHYIGKVVMSQTSEGESLPSYEDAVKIFWLNEETFTLKKKKKKLAGVQIICRIKDTTKQLLEFVLVLLMLITRPILEHKKITLLNLNLANVILVNSLIKFTLNYLVTNNGRRKEVKIKKEGKKVLAAGFRIHCFLYHKKQYTSYSRFAFNFIVSKSLL